MKTIYKKIVVTLLLCMLFLLQHHTQALADTLELDVQTDVPTTKEWRISFSSFVTEQTLNDAIFITTEDEHTYQPNYQIGDDGTSVIVLPPANGYEAGKTYTLDVGDSATSIYGETLEQRISMPFVIEQDAYTDVVVDAAVINVTDITLAPGETYMTFGAPEQQAETFIIPPDTYVVGDIIKMEPNDTFSAGFIRKIVAIEQKNGQWYAQTIFPTLEEAFAELDMNTSLALTADNLVDMELADRVTLASDDIGGGWEFALIDYLTTVEGNVYGINGSVQMDSLSLDVDFDKWHIVNGPHKFELNATMVASITIKPQKGFPLQKTYVELLNKEVELGKFTYRLPYGITVQLHAGFVVRPSVILGAEIAYTNTTDFTLGTLYKEKEFKKIAKFDVRKDSAKTLKGGALVKIGPRFTVEAGLLTLGVVNMHNDFGAYGQHELHYDIEEKLGACTITEAGVFYDMLIEIPALTPFKMLNTFPLIGKQVPIAEHNDCSVVKDIAFTKNAITATSDKATQLKVNAHWKDIVSAQTGAKDITEKVTYSTNDNRVRVSKTGKLSMKEAAVPYTATVTATYTHNGKTYSAVMTATFEPEAVDTKQFIAYLEEEGAPKGYYTMAVDSYSLTGQKNEEIVAVYFNEDNYETWVHVYSYHVNTAKWERTYSHYLYGPGYMEESGSLMNNKREQVIVSSYEGRYSSFIMLGSTDGQAVTAVIDESDNSYYFGFAHIKDQAVRVCESSQGKQFKWNGTTFKKTDVLCNPDAADIQPGDITIRYTIDANEKITSNYPNNHTFYLKKGQNIHFIRENFGVTERILEMGDGSYELIPGGYTWENAYTYYVKYTN